MKLATFFISRTGGIFTKLIAVSESSMKLKFRLHWTIFIILLTLAVICKHRLLHGSEIVHHLQNWKCYNVDQDHSRKSL